MSRPNLTTLEFLARGAGEIVRRGYNPRPTIEPHLEVEHKGVIDLVTEIDYQAESYLLQEINSRFPDHGLVTEESGGLDGNGDRWWYIDPLDGTVNYVHGVPVFSVSVAYAEEGDLRLGVVYDPVRDECFSAERGRGARLNGEPVAVSKVDRLNDSLLVTGFPYDIRINPDNNLDNFIYFSLRSQGVRRLGSAALDLCYVAAGRLDGFWEIRLNAWDVAAGGLIAQEAGATVTDLAGRPDFLSAPQSILAANPVLHQLMLQGLRESS